MIVKNYLYNVFYQILSIFVPLITMPYLTRTLGPSGMGMYSWSTSIANYFVLFATMGITIYGNREIAYQANKTQQKKVFVEVQLLHTLFAMTTIIAYVVFVYAASKSIVTFRHGFLALMIQSLLILAAALDISWFFMGIEDFKKTVVRNTFVRILNVILIFVLVRSQSDTLIYIFLIALTQVLGNASMWLYLRKYFEGVSVERLNVFRHVKPTFLLFLPTIATQLYVQLNRTMLPLFSNGNTAPTAYYDNADKILKIVLALLTSMGTVMMPRMANEFSKGNLSNIRDSINKSMEFMTMLAMPFMFGFFVIGKGLTIWFLGKSFSETGTVIIVLAPILVFIAWTNVIGLQFMMATNQGREYTISVSIGAVFNILLNFVLIPLAGVIGAAVATVLSEFIVLAAQIWLVKNKLTVTDLFSGQIAYLISAMVMFVVLKLLAVFITTNTFVGTTVFVVVGGIIYFAGLSVAKPRLFKIILEKIWSLKK